ncbi:PEX28-32 family peroxisomal membrane protein, partial [Ascoidea rubescens DSM 1968]
PADTRASFTNISSDPVASNVNHAHSNVINSSSPSLNFLPKASPLLASTPTTVSKALIRAYPYLVLTDKLLSILTWTNDNYFINLSILFSIISLVLYFEFIITYFGHILAVLLLFLYFYIIQQININNLSSNNLNSNPNNIVNLLTSVSIKSEILLSPITSLKLSTYDLKRLLFTTVFLSPIYIIVSFFFIKPKVLILLLLTHLLTYHSIQYKIIRRILWKSKTFKLISFYLTGLNFNKISSNSRLNNFLKLNNNNNTGISNNSTNSGNRSFFSSNDQSAIDDPFAKSSIDNYGKPIRFTYVLYENQRRWLGIGWTSNLLSYERAPWTDEFLNESLPPDDFKLPETLSNNDNLNNMIWKWVDKNWKLDLTNDGALTIPKGHKSKLVVDPRNDDGYIFYDNTWKKPSSEDSYSKYTRRRRWVRTAELI